MPLALQPTDRWNAEEQRDLPGARHEFGWAARTLDDSMQQAAAGGLACWQLALIGMALASDVAVSIGTLVLAHLTVCAIAGLLLLSRRPAWPALLAVYAVTILDYRAVVDVNSAFASMTLWGSILTTATPVLSMASRRATYGFSLLSLCVIAISLRVWHASWGWERLFITAATAAALAICAQLMMSGLRRLARDTDDREIATAAVQRDLMARRTAAQTAVADARTLHDTVINTLSAVATGGDFLRDTAVVRELCERDVLAVEAQLAGRSEDSPGLRLASRTIAYGIEVRRTGLDDDEADLYSKQLPPHVRQAAQGAVEELIRNAGKHSGTDWVGVDVQRVGSTIILTVTDEGKGFDGATIAGRGLAESVVARCREAGFEVVIQSAPNVGTTVTLTISLDQPSPANSGSEQDTTEAVFAAGQLRRSACWAWAAAMTGFGLASVLISRPDSSLGQCLMLAEVGGLSLAAWALCRGGRTLPGWLTLLVLAAIPLTFLTGLYGMEFGTAEVNDWPTTTMTPLLIVLLVTARSKAPVIIGVGLLVVTTVVTTYAIERAVPGAAATLPAGAATQFGLFTGWLVLAPVMNVIGTRRAQNQRESLKARSERAARDAVTAARGRWTTAGVHQSLEILRSIARGEADPNDSRVRAQCADAEHHLRQILSLNPEMVRMNPWLGHAMTAAHSKPVTLTLRGCTEDAPDETAAEAIGKLVLSAVAAAPAGTELIVSLFRSNGQLRLLIVGPSGSLDTVRPSTELPPGSVFTNRKVGAQDLVEFAVAEPPDGPIASVP